MRTNRATYVLGATGIIAASVAVAAQLQTAASAESPRRPVAQHIVLVDHTGPTSFDDLHPAGISVGDSFTFSETVSAHDKVVGSAGGTCVEVAVSSNATSQQCTITAVLQRGQIVAAGIATYSSGRDAMPVDYAITGGTGAFRTARGQVSVTPISDGSDRVVLDVITG